MISGRAPPGDLECDLLALPAQHGGIAVPNPAKTSDKEFTTSQSITEPLIDLILSNNLTLPREAIAKLSDLKKQSHQLNSLVILSTASDLRHQLCDHLKRAMELASEKGASRWLTALPLTEHSFFLHKGAFRDTLALRYGWLPLQTPAHCDCGANFSIDHSLSCPNGGFPSIKYNEVRDLTARLLNKICHDVRVEPHLQLLTGEVPSASTAITQDGARLDVEVNGFWGGRFERTFMDVRIFNPHASSNRNSHLSSTYLRHERTKKRAYKQRIREVEHACFTPLIFSASGGMAREATTFYKRLASLLSTKREQPYSSTMMWL